MPPSVISALRPVPPAVAAPALAPTPAPAVTPSRNDRSRPLKLEVIVYSDDRARRLAFINGRKYVEGDTLLDGAKIQEIQQNAVVIVEDGRRVVLRP
jgi:type II secretory pathway component PulC